MKRLVVHIGTGKTGSSSIQKFFKTHMKQLASNGIQYWGINLEHARVETQYAWKMNDGISILQRMSRPQARQEIHNALNEALESLPDGEIAVWSNESVYELFDIYIPILISIQKNSEIELAVVAYARNTKDYIISAYKQWGIKHKTYQGRILGFSEWIRKNHQFLSFGISLNEWDKAMPEAFTLKNYDAVSDVVQDFIESIPVNRSMTVNEHATSVNRSPTDIPLALYALYNNQFAEPVLPATISRLLSHYKIERGQYRIRALSSLFPSAQDLKETEALFREDTAIVNSILRRKKQPALYGQQSTEKQDRLDDQEIANGVMSLLLTICVKQDARISLLEEQLASLKISHHL